MATHSSILARKIPQTEEPGGLQSMGSQRVEHDQATDTDYEHVCKCCLVKQCTLFIMGISQMRVLGLTVYICLPLYIFQTVFQSGNTSSNCTCKTLVHLLFCLY